jgi:hypothetical protein
VDRKPHPTGVGVRSLSGERPAVMGACEWREFWRARGMRELLALLGSSWPPLAGASAVVREACAFRIASLLGSRARREAIAGELARIRRDELGLEPKPPEDDLAAGRVADWFAEASHP